MGGEPAGGSGKGTYSGPKGVGKLNNGAKNAARNKADAHGFQGRMEYTYNKLKATVPKAVQVGAAVVPGGSLAAGMAFAGSYMSDFGPGYQ